MAILEAGNRAPDFVLLDTEGTSHTLESATRDEVALLAFFSLECRACEASFLFWDRMTEAYEESGCRVLGISLDTPEAATDFYERSGVSFSVLVDADGSVARAYGVESTPSLFLVAAGSILSSHDALDRLALNALSEDIAGRVGVDAVLLAAGEAPDFMPGCTVHLDSAS